MNDPYGSSTPPTRSGTPATPAGGMPTPVPRRRARPGHAGPGGVPPRWLATIPYLFVLCGVALGLTLVAMDHFKRGSMLVAGVVFLGALGRLLLPESRLGLLAVRKRATDVATLVTLAAAIALVTYVVPSPT